MNGKRIATKIALAAFLAAAAAPAVAAEDPAAPGIDRSQEFRQDRIGQGVASGELTRQETDLPGREPQAIERAEDRARDDGTVTRPERARIHRMRNRDSCDIHGWKHDLPFRWGQGGPPFPGAERRQRIQQRRIGQGVATGRITPREAIRLEREQMAIERAKNRAAADGQVTAPERARLRRMQDRASCDIRRLKHNERRAH